MRENKVNFKEVIKNIKLHLNTKKELLDYYEFYADYLDEYAFNEFYENNIDTNLINKFKNDLENIVEQSEPWNDVKHFKPLDNQLRELLKKYNL